MMSFDALTVIIVLGAIQGFFLSFSILLKSGRRKSANLYLGLFVLCLSVAMVGRLAMTFPRSEVTPFLWAMMDSVLFLYGPLSYFYLKNLLAAETQSDKKMRYHFIPVSLHFIWLFAQLFINDFDRLFVVGRHHWANIAIEFAAIALNTFYFLIGLKIVRNYEKKFPDYFSSKPRQLKYIKLFQRIVAIVLILWLYGFLSKFITNRYYPSLLGYEMIWLTLSLITFAFSYLGLFDTAILTLPKKIKKPLRVGQPELYYDRLKVELENVMRTRKPFLNSQVTLNELSDFIRKNPRDISRTINDKFGMNFYDFINTYRIAEFRALAEKEESRNLTILALAYDAGFNSKSTFNASFKKLTRMTPKEYIGSLDSPSQ